MSQIKVHKKHQSISHAARSDSSNNSSTQKNRERVEEFKKISLKRNSLMEHLLANENAKNFKAQTSILFHS